MTAQLVKEMELRLLQTVGLQRLQAGEPSAPFDVT
jgi:hypothetical protein